MSGITSHVLDTSKGAPAAGITIQLESETSNAQWQTLNQGITDADGRVANLAPTSLPAGNYRISFLVEEYFEQQDVKSFYPVVRIEFKYDDPKQHYHVPLLLNPFGYSTYRGS